MFPLLEERARLELVIKSYLLKEADTEALTDRVARPGGT